MEPRASGTLCGAAEDRDDGYDVGNGFDFDGNYDDFDGNALIKTLFQILLQHRQLL